MKIYPIIGMSPGNSYFKDDEDDLNFLNLVIAQSQKSVEVGCFSAGAYEY